MAGIIYGAVHDVWGRDSFIEQDYIGWLEDYYKTNRIDKIASDEFRGGIDTFAGLILDNTDTDGTVYSFLDLCAAAERLPTFIVIEFCHLTDPEEAASFREEIEDYINGWDYYIDLKSYETKTSFALRPEYRPNI